MSIISPVPCPLCAPAAHSLYNTSEQSISPGYFLGKPSGPLSPLLAALARPPRGPLRMQGFAMPVINTAQRLCAYPLSGSAHSAFSVTSVLNPPFLSTFNFRLSTFVSVRAIPFLFTLMRTPLHSSKSQLFCFQAIPHSLPKTPGVWVPHSSQNRTQLPTKMRVPAFSGENHRFPYPPPCKGEHRTRSTRIFEWRHLLLAEPECTHLCAGD